MDIITGVKVVIAGLLVSGCAALIWLLELAIWGNLSLAQAIAVQVIVAAGAIGISWYGLFGPGFFGAGKRR